MATLVETEDAGSGAPQGRRFALAGYFTPYPHGSAAIAGGSFTNRYKRSTDPKAILRVSTRFVANLPLNCRFIQQEREAAVAGEAVPVS
jgi:hypothetical protein